MNTRSLDSENLRRSAGAVSRPAGTSDAKRRPGASDSVGRGVARVAHWLRLLLLSGGVAIAITGCPTSPGPSLRVVLITLDTLRYDHFNPGDGGESAMPLTRAHADRGLRFTRFITASPVTQPTHSTLFTGLQPWEHGITRNGVLLPDHLPSIVEAFNQEGFETRAVVASFPLASIFGFARGFDDYDEDFSEPFRMEKKTWEGEWEVPGGEFYSRGDQITQRALQALDRARGEKQFFWFHYFDPHAPYGKNSDEPLLRSDIIKKNMISKRAGERALKRAKEGYAADVGFLDRSLDELLRRLEDEADTIETHIFVVADHGESLGEGDSMGHGSRLTKEQIRVPAFLLSPAVTPAAQSDVAGTIDIPPTLLSLAGISSSFGAMQGRDLTKPAANNGKAYSIRRTYAKGKGRERHLDGVTYVINGYLFSEAGSDGVIRQGNSEKLANPELIDDAGRERLTSLFRSFEESIEATTAVEVLDPEVIRGLEALGYAEE